MKLLVATDAHIFKTPDGKHWTPAIYGYSFWERYLNVFDEVRVVARTKNVSELPEKALLVDGPGVEVFHVPFYQGPKELLKVFFKVHKALQNVSDGCDVAIFRMPSQTAQMAYQHVKRKIPIGGEIVYDPTDDLQRKNVSLFIHILDLITSYRLKKFCLKANGVSYVTKETIQKNYPSEAKLHGESEKFFETYYSTITLKDEAFSEPRDYLKKQSLVIGFSNVSMNSDRKGEKTLIRAVKLARDFNCNVSAILIGDGSMRKQFEALAEELEIKQYIHFMGRLSSSEEVRKALLNTDLFVFPSQAEGLPRGILEAMAIGLPVLSTPVGGIPEVIDKKYLFSPNDVDGIAKMICHLALNKEELNAISKANYLKAQEFRNNLLQGRRDDFYRKLSKVND